MGSQLRKLRAKAGVTGRAHQKRQREAARRKERARFSFQDGNIIVGLGSPGGQLRSSEELRSKLTPAMVAGASPAFASDLAFQKIRLEEQRIQLAHILGSHEGAEELADAIHLAAVARAQASVGQNSDVIQATWEQALAELRRGVATGDLTVLNGPKVLVVGDDGPSAAAAIAMAAERVAPQVAAPPATPEPGLRQPKRRMPPLAVLALLGMVGGLAVPPRRDR